MNDIPVISFVSSGQWEAWLAKHHAEEKGIWLQFYKKNSGMQTITHAEALDAALCWGWIDGQVLRHDDISWRQKFTPRRAKSIWSKRNIEHVTRLAREGKMKPPGIKAIEAAKSDGRWRRAYDSPKNMVVPEDFLKALEKNKQAKAFFETLNKANRYAIAWRLQTAKKVETRERRLKKMLEMMAKGEKFHL